MLYKFIRIKLYCIACLYNFHCHFFFIKMHEQKRPWTIHTVPKNCQVLFLAGLPLQCHVALFLLFPKCHKFVRSAVLLQKCNDTCASIVRTVFWTFHADTCQSDIDFLKYCHVSKARG